MDKWSVDPRRVYLVGSSSGGFMTSILGATYPDLFAAIAIICGGPYASTLLDALQPVGPQLVPIAFRAKLAREAMGENARVVPVLAMHGDQDTTVYPQNGINAIEQWLMTNNLVVSGTASGPFPLTPTALESGLDAGGASFERQDFRSSDGCIVARHVLIHGQGHGWPGRIEDSNAVVDPLPMGTRMSWEFFKNYTKESGEAIPCRSATYV
jgi:poly(3-hydroxybutyrate) depolymerase